MRIMHVISYTTPEAGGSVLLALNLARRLAGRGHEVAVYTTNQRFPKGVEDVPLDRPVDMDGVAIHYFPCEFGPMLISRRMGAAFARDMTSFDVVHSHGIYRYPQIAAGHYARRAGVPYIVRPHGSLDPFVYNQKERRLFKRVFERLFMYRYLNSAALLHFTDQEELERIRFLGLQSEPVVVPNGIDTAIYHRPDLEGRFRALHGLGDRKILLHLGRIARQKGLDITVRAFAKLRHEHPDAVLVIAGPDNTGFTATVDGWIADAGVGDAVLYTGMLTGETKLAALVDADLFVSPSYFENFGTTVVEAMAAGTPVAISDQVYIWREIVEPGAGLATPLDVEAFAAALSAILADPGRCRAMGERAFTVARQRFDWNSVLPGIEAAYATAIARRHPGYALAS